MRYPRGSEPQAYGRSPRRTVTVPPWGKTASLDLGKREWPFYRLGENGVPFEPPNRLVALAFPGRRPSGRAVRTHVERLCESLPLKPYAYGRDKDLPFAAADGAIWLPFLTT